MISPTMRASPLCSRLDCSAPKVRESYLCANHLSESKKQGQKYSAWDDGYAFGMQRGQQIERQRFHDIVVKMVGDPSVPRLESSPDVQAWADGVLALWRNIQNGQ